MVHGYGFQQDPAGAAGLSHHHMRRYRRCCDNGHRVDRTSGTHTPGTTGVGCHLCLYHGPPILPETTWCRVLGAALEARLWETISREE
jgi:hypothetical protein